MEKILEAFRPIADVRIHSGEIWKVSITPQLSAEITTVETSLLAALTAATNIFLDEISQTTNALDCVYRHAVERLNVLQVIEDISHLGAVEISRDTSGIRAEIDAKLFTGYLNGCFGHGDTLAKAVIDLLRDMRESIEDANSYPSLLMQAEELLKKATR